MLDPLHDPLKEKAVVPQKYVDAMMAQGWVKVVHSTYHLHHREDFSAPPCECNNCHCEFTVDDVEEDCHYCPKCGAKLDGGEEP